MQHMFSVVGVPVTIEDLEKKEIRGLKYLQLRECGHIKLLARQTGSMKLFIFLTLFGGAGSSQLITKAENI